MRLLPVLGPGVSLVGGAVRDALLDRPQGGDLDLVVEGPAIDEAGRVARALGGRLTVHERFGTANVRLAHGAHVDLTSARRERYSAPGALPDVEAGTLEEDLARRDFAINAIALRLTGEGAGTLVDPEQGRRDLGARLVRSLRADAFEEDPSRVVRAARYAARLDFALEPGTAAAARAAAPALDPSGPRVGEELRRLLGEDRAQDAVALLTVLGVPWIREDRERLDAIDRALALDGAPPLPAWAVRLGAAVDPARLHEVAVAGWARELAGEVADGEALARRLDGLRLRSDVDRILRRARPGAVVGAAAAGSQAVAGWWREDRDRRPEIGGADLIAAGVAPGPAIGRALEAVRAALLDGEVAGRDDQLELALRVAAEEH